MVDTAYPVGTLNIRGQEVEVVFDRRENSGYFQATLAGSDHLKRTLEELRTHLMNVSRKSAVKVSIPVSDIVLDRGKASLRHGFLTGIHQGTSKVLVRWDDGMGGILAGCFTV